MVNHSKPILDAPIPATVPVTSAPGVPTTVAAVSSAAPVVALPQPLLPTSQGQETKQGRACPILFLLQYV
jgi:hypothetical protein